MLTLDRVFLAANTQYYSKDGIPGRVAAADICVVCGNSHANTTGVGTLVAPNGSDTAAGGSSGAVEGTIQLECGHMYAHIPTGGRSAGAAG